METGFLPNDALTLDRIPTPDGPMEDICCFADSFDARPGTPRYVRGCLPEDWDDSPKSLTKLRAVLYAGFHSLAWTDERESLVRKQIERIREKVSRGEWE